jgi:hypothetical protein
VRANVAETYRSAPAGRTGAVASIAMARGAIIWASDWDREHLIPDPNRLLTGRAMADPPLSGVGAR